jgi:hypothetical protein
MRKKINALLCIHCFCFCILHADSSASIQRSSISIVPQGYASIYDVELMVKDSPSAHEQRSDPKSHEQKNHEQESLSLLNVPYTVDNESLFVHSNEKILNFYLQKNPDPQKKSSRLILHLAKKIIKPSPFTVHMQLHDLFWAMRYVMVLSPDHTTAHVQAWIDVANNTHYTYQNTRVHFLDKDNEEAEHDDHATPPSFSLHHDTTLMKGLTTYKWFSCDRVPIEQEQRVNVGGSLIEAPESTAKQRDWYPSIEKWLLFSNIQSIGLGRYCPKGPLIIYKQHKNGALQKLLSNDFPKTALNQTVRIKIQAQEHSTSIHKGKGLQTLSHPHCSIHTHIERTSYRRLSSSIYEMGYRVRMTNYSKKAEFLKVVLNHEGKDVTLLRESIPHAYENPHEVIWDIPIEPTHEHKPYRVDLSYRIRVSVLEK